MTKWPRLRRLEFLQAAIISKQYAIKGSRKVTYDSILIVCSLGHNKIAPMKTAESGARAILASANDADPVFVSQTGNSWSYFV